MTRLRNYLIFIFVFTGSLLGADKDSETVSWGVLVMTLLGGLALFLYGIRKMSVGMKKAAGSRMSGILFLLTNNRFVGLFVGAFVTMVIQSSSATTVMLVSFVQAGLMSFVQSLGVILGADIGTTITAQLIAFRLTDYSLLIIAVGFGLTFFSRRELYQYLGEALLGFGILFFGMKLMSEAMDPLRTYQPFIDVLKGLENPILGMSVGTVFTALIQSSSAFTGILIVLGQQNFLTLEAAIPLLFGANIGTCVTAGLASVGATREAKRVALAHVLFKIGGVALFVFWIPLFADLVRTISPTAQSMDVAALSFATPRQIANAHTVFNVSLAMAFLPFTAIFARYARRILPEEERIETGTVERKLDESSISTPALAIDVARSEISRMAGILGNMLQAIIHPFLEEEPSQDVDHPHLSLVEGIKMNEKEIDVLDERVSHYLIRISREELDGVQAKKVFAMMSIVKDMESIGDVIDKNILPLIAKKQSLGAAFSREGTTEILAYHTKVCKQISRLKEAFATLDPEKAAKVLTKEEKYVELESEYRLKHLERVQQEKEESVATHEIHMELLDLLKQINVYTASIGKTILEMTIPSMDK
ncbi:MAG: Na/Pi cotransporter family protein [Candidatus Neomarinimicrobiota bacterium]